MRGKKGFGLDGMYAAVVLIVTIGIILGVGILVLNETALATSNTEFTSSENVTAVSNVATVTNANDCGFHNFAVSSVVNGSGTEIALANFTTNALLGTIDNSSGVGLGFGGVQAWVVNHTYLGTSDTSSTGSCNAMGTTQTGVGGFAQWIAVIVVVLAAAIVLGIVINSFGRNRSV